MVFGKIFFAAVLRSSLADTKTGICKVKVHPDSVFMMQQQDKQKLQQQFMAMDTDDAQEADKEEGRHHRVVVALEGVAEAALSFLDEIAEAEQARTAYHIAASQFAQPRLDKLRAGQRQMAINFAAIDLRQVSRKLLEATAVVDGFLRRVCAPSPGSSRFHFSCRVALVAADFRHRWHVDAHGILEGLEHGLDRRSTDAFETDAWDLQQATMALKVAIDVQQPAVGPEAIAATLAALTTASQALVADPEHARVQSCTQWWQQHTHQKQRAR